MAKFLKFLKVFTIIGEAVLVAIALAGALAKNTHDIIECVKEKKKLKAELQNS